MLIPQHPQRDSRVGQGSPRVSFAELRKELASPSRISDGVRQRLLELAQRVAHVQELGDEYARVGLSEEAAQGVGRIGAA